MRRTDIIEKRIRERGDLPHATVERQLELLKLLQEFSIGRCLIEIGGIDAHATHSIMHPKKEGRMNAIEDFLLDRAPVVVATQERNRIFLRETQKRLRDGSSFAAIPCGFMGELLDLDFSQVRDVHLTGVDINPKVFAQAALYAAEKEMRCTFVESDAWKISLVGSLDLITSNGLSIYEPSDERVVELYCKFFTALKPGGVLVTSALTPPAEWDFTQIVPEDAAFQKLLILDILESRWNNFRSVATTLSLLEKAGFTACETFFDKARLFPTFVAVNGLLEAQSHPFRGGLKPS